MAAIAPFLLSTRRTIAAGLQRVRVCVCANYCCCSTWLNRALESSLICQQENDHRPMMSLLWTRQGLHRRNHSALWHPYVQLLVSITFWRCSSFRLDIMELKFSDTVGGCEGGTHTCLHREVCKQHGFMVCSYALNIVCACVDYSTRISYLATPFRTISSCALWTQISKTWTLFLNSIKFVSCFVG